MKFADNVLLEIILIVQKGLTEGIDVSEEMRALDVEVQVPTAPDVDQKVALSKKYLASKGRVF